MNITDRQAKTFSRLLVVVSAVISLAIVLFGYRIFLRESQTIRQEKFNDLKTIAALKVDQIVNWRQSRLEIVRMNTSGAIRILFNQWLKAPRDPNVISDIMNRITYFRNAEGCQDIFIADPDGKILFSATSTESELGAISRQLIIQTISENKAIFGAQYRCPICGQLHLDVLAPIRTPDNRPVAVLIMRINPNTWLYPFIQSWPVFSKSAETLLVQKDGNDVLFLNALRHRPDIAPLTLRIPLSRTDALSVQAVLGHKGCFEGKDYRGVDVISDSQTIPGTSWFLIAKMDTSEVMADMTYRRNAIALSVILGILLTAAMAASAYFSRTGTLYQRLFQTEQKQRELQGEIGATLYSIGDGVIVTDKSGHIRRLNPVAETLTGWKEAEAIDKPLFDVFQIINERTRQRVNNPVEQVIQDNVVVGLANHTLLVSRDSLERPIADSAAPIHDDNGDIIGVVLVFRDQTEERHTMNKLLASEQFVRSTLDGLSYMIAIVDAAGTILYVNQAWLDFGEANQAEMSAIMPGANYLEICQKAEGPESDGAMEFATGLTAVLSGTRSTFAVEYPCHSPDEKRWFIARVTKFPHDSESRAIIAHENITERKQIENTQLFLLQLGTQENHEDFFEALALYLHDTLGSDFVCIDRLEGDLKTARTVAIYFDGKFRDNITYTLKDTPCGDVVGKTVCVFQKDVRGMFPKDEVLQEMVAESYVGVTLWNILGEAIGLIAVISRKPLANSRLAEAVLKLVGMRTASELEGRQAMEALLTKQRELENLNFSLEDRIRKAVDELRQKDQVLIHQSRMAAMGEMIGNIAHQWRQPLNALGLVVANIKDAHDYKELDATYLNQAIADSNRLIQKMSSTISDFANFFRPDKKIAAFSGLKQIRDAIALVEASFKSNNVTIQCDTTEDVMLLGFPNEFSQVLLNLLVNAKDAIKASKTPNGCVVVNLTSRNGRGCITVRDNGGGIPEDIIGRIFDPYFSTKQQGSGIGLYMSKMIIEDNMNGAITARNIENGAEFIICIPLS